MEDDGFQLVTSRRRRHKDAPAAQKHCCDDHVALDNPGSAQRAGGPCQPEEDQHTSEQILQRLETCKDTLNCSQFWSDTASALKQTNAWRLPDATGSNHKAVGNGAAPVDAASYTAPPSIVCYGIGNFGSSPQARHQFALLMVLAEALQAAQVHVFDPCLSPSEQHAITTLGKFLCALAAWHCTPTHAAPTTRGHTFSPNRNPILCAPTRTRCIRW